MNKSYILSIDNGATGSFTILDNKGKLVAFEHVPNFKVNSWKKPKAKKTKTGKVSKSVKQSQFTVIDINQLQKKLVSYLGTVNDVKCFLERPAVGFSGWGIWTSLAGFSNWVAVQYVLMNLKIPYETVDSKEWQDALIPQATGKNNKEYLKGLKKGERNKLLKQASDKLAKEMFPRVVLKELGDGDSLCMGYYYFLKEEANEM